MSGLPKDLTQKIRDAVDPEALLRKINYRPETIQVAGPTIKAFCPIHREPVFRTLVIEKSDWSYKCTNKQCAGAKGGDLIDFYAKTRGINYEEAVLEMSRLFDIEVDGKLVSDYVTQALEIGSNFLEMGVFAEAESQFEAVLRMQPNSLPALRGMVKVLKELGRSEKLTPMTLRLSRVLFEQGDYAEAAGLMEEYVRYTPDDAETRMLYIQCLQRTGRKEEVAHELIHLAEGKTSVGDIDEALKLYRQVQEMNIETLDVSAQIIQILISAGRQDEAVEEVLQRARVLHRAGSPQGAIKCYLSALEIDPARDDIRVKIAQLVARERMAGEAFNNACAMIRQMLRQVTAHGPAAQALEALMEAFADHPRLLELKGDLEEERGNEESATEIRLHCMDLFEKRKEYDAALDLVDRALQRTPDSAPMLSRRAALLAELGRPEDAAKAYLDIISAFQASGDYEHAAGAYQAVIELQPASLVHRQKQFELYLKAKLNDFATEKGVALARAYLEGREPGKAAQVVERLFTFLPDSTDLLAMHAEALEQLSRKGEAAEQFLSAAKLAIQKQSHEEARQLLERSLKCMPEHMESRELRAEVLMLQRNTAQAIREFEELAQFYLRADEMQNVIRIALKILAIEPDRVSTLQLMTAAYGKLGDVENQRATQLRMVWIYRQQKSFTMAREMCGEILLEDESFTPAVEQLLAIAEASKKTEDVLTQLWRLAQIHQQTGRNDEEKKALAAILQREPLHEGACKRHIEVLLQWGEPQELALVINQAIERFTAAHKVAQITKLLEDLRSGPSPKPELLSGLARIYRSAKDTAGLKDTLRMQAQLLARALRDAEAIEVWGELAKLLPEDLSIRRSRIELMLRSKKNDEAAEEYRFLGDYYAQHNQVEAAEAAHLDVLKLLPEDRPSQESLISLYIKQEKHAEATRLIESLAGQDMQRGDYEGATATYERLLDFQAQPEDVYRKIIAVKQRAGDTPGALRYYDRMLDLLAGEGRSGAFEQAVHDAVLLDPDNWAIRSRLADHLIKAGRMNEAEAVLRDMAILQLRAEKHDLAAKTIDQMLEFNKESVQGRALRAELMARQGNKDMALSQFMELADSLSQMKGSIIGAPSSPFAFGNYEGLTRVKEYTFSQFVVGSRNNFAYATAQAVSRAPGKNYNPLFLYADVGMGKTHLCHAIANYVLDHHPNLKVLYTMTEDFVGALIDSIQTNTVTHFRNRYRSADVLIMDDIQFLSGKERAQEEFFHVFNALFEGGKQIIITSDRPPKEIKHLENRLRSRFGAGIIVDIQAPDLETRIAIIRRELIQKNINNQFSDEAVLYLAESVATNIRELKGALIQVMARYELSKDPITIQVVQAVVERMMDRVEN